MSQPAHRSSETIQSVRRFWSSHINNEYYTAEQRASETYFDEIERKRYRWHYHLRDLFARLEGGGDRLLDIGCGIGVDSIQLARRGFAVTAIDLTDSAIQVAPRYAEARGVKIDFHVGNAEELAFAEGSFDAVYSFGVLHHTPQIERAVAEVRRVLKPGGIAHVMLYNKLSLVNFIHWLFRLPYESPLHLKDRCPVVYTFSKRGVSDLFSDFSDVEVRAEYPFTYGLRYLTFWIPALAKSLLGRWIGWHLMIRATR